MPKRFDDMTDAEVLALTEEQIAYIIDFECADNGSGLLPPDPGPAPEPLKDMKDLTVFEFGGLFFSTHAQAFAVSEVAAMQEQWETKYVNGYYGDQAVQRREKPEEITPRKFYSLAGWDAAKGLVVKYSADKKEWDERTAEYKKIADTRASSTEWIRNRISEVRDEDWRRQRAVSELARYVELAEGDEAMARRFFAKAKPGDEKYLPPMEAQAPQVAS